MLFAAERQTRTGSVFVPLSFVANAVVQSCVISSGLKKTWSCKEGTQRRDVLLCWSLWTKRSSLCQITSRAYVQTHEPQFLSIYYWLTIIFNIAKVFSPQKSGKASLVPVRKTLASQTWVLIGYCHWQNSLHSEWWGDFNFHSILKTLSRFLGTWPASWNMIWLKCNFIN